MKTDNPILPFMKIHVSRKELDCRPWMIRVKICFDYLLILQREQKQENQTITINLRGVNIFGRYFTGKTIFMLL